MNNEPNHDVDNNDSSEDSTLPEHDASASRAVPGDGSRKLPEITIQMKRLPEAVVDAQKALIAHNTPPTLFKHGCDLVRVLLTAGRAPALVPMKTVDLQAQLTFAARWFEQTGKEVKPIYPPSLLVNALMQRVHLWAPSLDEVVGIPIFDHNWSLMMQPGYHPGEQIYYHPTHPPVDPVPEHPSTAEVAEAVRLLGEELLGDFPFVTPADRAAAIAPIIAPFVRRCIDGATPLHLFESPTPGSGKTLLADVVSIPSLGKEPAASTEIANADDLRKSITAMAMSGEKILLLDNINARLKGAALAAALTKVGWTDRIIGTSKMVSREIHAVWLATANNISMTAELARRIVRSRIDPGIQQPHMRTHFRHPDLRAWAKVNRPQLIRAILVLVRHWLAESRPSGGVILGSYESYCRIIGGILGAAGIDGFLGNIQSDQRHADDETVEWEAFIRAWADHIGEKKVVAEALDKTLLAPNPEMLSMTLASASSQRGRRIKLGQELRKRRDAIIAGWRIKVSDHVDRHGCWSYRLLNVAES